VCARPSGSKKRTNPRNHSDLRFFERRVAARRGKWRPRRPGEHGLAIAAGLTVTRGWGSPNAAAVGVTPTDLVPVLTRPPRNRPTTGGRDAV
jgi:hypothetical protein